MDDLREYKKEALRRAACPPPASGEHRAHRVKDAARGLRRCRRIRGGILDCRCARCSAERQGGTKGRSVSIAPRDVALDLNRASARSPWPIAELDAHNSLKCGPAGNP